MLREDFERLASKPQGLRQILKLYTMLGVLLSGATVGRLTLCGVAQLSCSPFCIKGKYRGYFLKPLEEVCTEYTIAGLLTLHPTTGCDTMSHFVSLRKQKA